VTIQVRLFAMLRERAGRDSLELEVPDGATVGDAMALLAREPGLDAVLDRLPVRAARNREYVDEGERLEPGDELALIPPVSGGSDHHARVTDEPLSIEHVSAAVGLPGAGAIVVFAGTTREVERLEYEAYREMAEERIATILDDCVVRHGLEAAAAEHRVGSVPLGEPSVVVAVAAAHRGEAFAGAREAIDRIKAEAPIWKREVEGSGDAERARWVEGTAPEPAAAAAGLTHLDPAGRARMVDVGAKPETERRARAEARLRMSVETARAVERGEAPKGDVLGTARLAGIQAAKRTWELIPLAHPLALDFVDVEARVEAADGVVLLAAEAGTTARTGVEMEAMTACAVAALAVYDMVKGLERGVSIEAIELVHKSGGRSGEWRRTG
jgi:molybdenum cofactor biosynthesis protein MoaC/molybdopterin converting factor subunit 1